VSCFSEKLISPLSLLALGIVASDPCSAQTSTLTSGASANVPSYNAIDVNGVDTLTGFLQVRSPVLSAGPKDNPVVFYFRWNGKTWLPNIPTIWQDKDNKYIIDIGGNSYQFSKGVKATQTNEFGAGAIVSPSGYRYDYTLEKPNMIGAHLWCYWTGPISGQAWPSSCFYVGISGEGARFGGNLPLYGSYPPGVQKNYELFGNLMLTLNFYGSADGGQVDYGRLQGGVLTAANPVGGSILAEYSNGYTVWTEGQSNSNRVFNLPNLTYALGSRDPAAAALTQRLIINTPNLNPQNSDNTFQRPKNVIQTMSNSLGETWSYTFDGNGRLTKITSPSGIVSNYKHDKSGRVIEVSGPNGVFRYSYDFSESSVGAGTTTVTNPLNQIRRVFHDRKPGPAKLVVDELGRSTSYAYDQNDRLNSVTYPGGGGERFDYDNLGRIVSASKFVDISDRGTWLTTTYQYDPSCTTARAKCGAPVAITDARGNVTNYEYSYGSFALPTAIIGPEPSPGAGRPISKKTYVALPYFYKDTSDNKVSTRHVVLSQERQCRSVSPCEGTTDEVVTSYSYAASYAESNGSGNNVIPTEIVVRDGAGNEISRSKQISDGIGNIIETDGPRIDVDDRRYTTFDRLRRPVFEISTDPDGTGPLSRAITRHFYDAEGKETQTQYGTGFATDGSDFVVTRFQRMTYDFATGRLLRTEAVIP
jgi:YD repeat-containing protein